MSKPSCELTGYFSFGPLKSLFSQGRKEYILYLDLGHNPELPGIRDDALYLTVQNGSLSALKRLDLGFSLSEEELNNALGGSVKFSHLHILKYLLKRGAKIDKKDEEIYREAGRVGNLQVLKLIMPFASKENMHIAFQAASLHGHLPAVKYFTQRIKVDYKNLDFAFVRACARNDLEVAKVLLQKGADITSQGNNAFYFASSYGAISIVKYLYQMPLYGEDLGPAVGKAMYLAEFSRVKGGLAIVNYLRLNKKEKNEIWRRFLRTLSLKELMKGI